MSILYRNTLTGGAGEELAKEYLVERGLLFITANYRVRAGEIDLIMRKNRTLYFIEVKTRNGMRYGYPELSVTKNKIEKIERTAQNFLIEYERFSNYTKQVLVVSILYESENSPPSIKVFEV